MLEIILKILKIKLGNYYILCIDQKNLQKVCKSFIKAWLILYVFKNTSCNATYKNGNNLYEH